ncbi:RcnB family protein [Dryocola clanedunensis]|uniref:RcnB family protein n=1 Tax=Cedecea sulfonylureivorans TaxID=3051154 RepID=UPI001929499C|nr:RcnB family protein [Cedecea sulfonylureivorans]
MRKSKIILLSALFMTLPVAFSAQAYGEPAKEATPKTTATPKTSDPSSFELKEFFADYKHFAIGDVVPDLYRTKPYQIDAWQIRHLPAPEAGSHWTYMGGNYVLITDAEGKILRAEKGEIFYGN